MSAPRFITAFGETKSLADWSRDSRCVVSYLALAARLDKHGFTPELAITKPRRNYARNHVALFWAKVNKINDGCWLWTGPLNKKGYGVGYDGDRTIPAHTIAYAWTIGPVPQGLELDHKCRVRHCVNPEHLEPMTHLENINQSPFRLQRNLICKNGHLFTSDNTILLARGVRVCRQCMRAANKRHYEKHKAEILECQRERYARKSHTV